MSRTRTYVYYFLVIDTNHRTAGTSKNADIQRTDICIMASDLGIVYTGTAILDYTDIGCCSTYLKVNGIGCS